MAENNDANLNIEVNAVANKQSAEQAVNELVSGVQKASNKGRIEVPVDITVPIDNTKKKLTKAQEDITSEISKMMAKGFSASGKDIDTLTSKFEAFIKALDAAGKGRQNKTFREIRRQVEELQKSYKALKTETNSAKSYTPKATNTRKSTKRNLTSEEKQLSKERIDNAVEQVYKRKGYDKLSKDLSKGASRAKAATPGASINLGVRSPAMGGPYVSEETLRKSDISPYALVDETRKAREAQEIKKAERASLTSRRATTEEIEDSKQRVKQREAAGRSQSGTEYELVKKALLTELAKIQGGLIKGRPDTTSQKLIDQVLANLTYDEQNGVDPLKSIMGIHKMLQKRYDTKGKIGITDGSVKGEGKNQEETNETLKQIYKILGQFIDARQAVVDNVRNIRDTLVNNRSSDKNSLYNQELNRIMNSDQMQAMKDALNPISGTLTRTLAQNTREGTRESIADQAAGRASREGNSISSDILETVEQDASTGFNTEKASNALIKATDSGLSDIFSVLSDIRDILQTITVGKIAGGISGGGSIGGQTYKKPKIHGLPTDIVINPETGLFYKTKAKGQRGRKPKVQKLPTVFNIDNEQAKYDAARRKRLENSIEEERIQIEKGEHPSQQRSFLESSNIFTTQKGIFGQLRKIIKDILPQTEVDKIMSANAQEQARMRAERIETYGLNRGRDLTDTGDIADVKRTKSLFGWIYKNDEKNKQLFQDVQLTPGFTGDKAIDTTSIMEALNKVLSGSEMFKAQTGGTLRNIIGSFTGYIGMPSIEKSRAQAEGLNQVMANVRNEVLQLIQDIQAKESTLLGMQERGTARFDREGRITDDSSLAAKNTFTKLEEQKGVLRAALAEVGMIDQVVTKTGGKVSKIIKNLGFVMPELMKNNTIIQNINAGLDKNGKALKFQTRLAEILNYSFQLMSRHIGQILKNWLWMINPLNLIKKTFDDFASYDPKWQRTMNVIKNNFREIILPFMQKIAQTLVNIIGFLDIISMKIQAAFGYTPISLFDQENANDFKKTYEEISNITASFDELHDIGSSGGENDPDNLLGEIYKPQLSQEWIDLANKIGDLFADVIKGDLGFGEAMLRILEILGETLAIIAKKLWDWFKTTDFGKWLIENWKTVLATILALFLGWKLLKIFGPTLLSTIGGAFKTLLAKIGGWITTLLGASGFGQGIMLAFQSLLAGGKYSLIGTLKEMFTNSAAITQAGSWGSMIGFALVKGLVGVLSIALGGKMVADAFDSAADKTSYNIGLEQAGGNEEDKKGIGGDVLKGAAGGAAIGFGVGQIIPVVGPLVGAAIGAVAGALTTSLAPAFEAVEVSAREANNEMQKIEYYEGAVQGATTQVETFTELENQMTQAVEAQTNKVYAQGEQLGISKTRMDELVASVQNGTYHTGMLSDTEMNLASSLEQLSALQTKNKEATDQLTEAKRKLQAAEMDLAIAQDIEAEHYEVAAARIEAAFASGTYTAEEAGEQMAMLLKQVNGDMKANLLENMTPDMKKNFAEYVNTTDTGKKDLVKIYEELNDEQKDVFKQNYGDLFAESIDETLAAGQKRIDETELDWSHPFQSLGKVFSRLWEMIFGGGSSTNSNSGDNNARSVKTASFATGTNYVPSNGLAYLHQGEAVIPKKYNKPYEPTNNISQAYLDQMINTMKSLDNTIQQGIEVRGEFKQRGTDLVATVKKVENRNGNQPLNNSVFAR